MLTVTKVLDDTCNYPKASGNFINQVQIYNVDAEPQMVTNSWASNMQNQSRVDIEWIWNPEERSLTLKNFLIPVDSGLRYGMPVDLITVLL